MQLVEENAIARGMIRVGPGEDLVASIEQLAQAAGWQDAFVTGAGELELVELATGAAEPLTLEGAAVTQLAGRIRSRDGGCRAVLRASVLAGGALHSGTVVAAVTGDLLLIVDAVATPRAATVERGAERRPGAVLSGALLSAVPRLPDADALSSQAPDDALQYQAGQDQAGRGASVPLSQSFTTKPRMPKISRGNDPEGSPDDIWMDVDAGDYLDHPQLGFCEVVGDDASGGTRIRVPSGRVRVLRLDALQVLAPDLDDDGRRVFKVAGPRRRF